MTFIEGSNQAEMVDTDVGDESPAISSTRSQGSGGLSEHQRRNLLATPPRGPVSRLPSEQTEKETEEYESAQESPANSADTRSVALVRLSDETTGVLLTTVWIKKLLKV